MRKAGRMTSLGKHQLLVELARGGMGVVHLAVVRGPAGFSKLVVIKELPLLLSSKPELVEMFLEEARIAARLNHPNIVQTNEVGSEGKRHYLVMEYLEGQSLRTLLKAVDGGPRLPLSVHLHILIDALSGLHYAHQLTDYAGKPLNVVHRDVSPHNLFVTYAGVTKVVDFGLARASDTLRNTGSGILRGKLGYMAPEHLRGEAVDRRADIFSIGVMLWEALAGRRLWRGLTELAVAHLLSAGDIPPLRDANPNVPPDLERICERALAADPKHRYATARDMQADLEVYLGRQGKHATPRGVGTLVAELFREDRERVTRIVDSQLEELRAHGARAEMVSLVDPDASSSVPRVAAATLTDARDDEDLLPTEVFLAETAFMPTPPPMSISMFAPRAAPPSPVSLVRALSHRGARLVAGAALLLAGIGIGVAVGAASRGPDHAALAAAPPPPREPGTLKLSVRATPPFARILLDDAPRGVGSFDSAFPRDGRRHTLRIEAEGYVPATEELVFEQSVHVRIALERSARR